MEMHWHSDLFTEGFDECARRKGAAESGHVLHRQHVRTHFFQLLGNADVVFERILRASRIEDITRVAECAFANALGFAHRLHRGFHVRQVVQRIENAEDVHATLGGVLDEAGDDIGRVVRIADRIRTAQEHLEADIRNPLAQVTQPVPRILVQEAHRGVEGRSAPHFQTEKFRGPARYGIRYGCHVVGADTGGEERLMSVSEGRVRKKQSLLASRPLREFLGSELEQKLACAFGRHLFAIVGWSSCCLQGRGNLVPLGLGISIHDHIREE